MDLNGRHVLVTGASTGLGRAMALGLLEAGATVAVADRGAAELDSIRPLVAPFGSRAHLLAADLNDAAEAARLALQAVECMGQVDVLINNAGISSGIVREDFVTNPVRFWEHSEAHIRRFFEINSIAPFLLAARLVGAMIERRWGRIINVTTSLDSMLRRGMTGYGGSKAGLEAHTAIMAGDLRGTGVTANVLVPGGPADTPMIPMSAGFDRAAMIQPSAMVPPIRWLASADSDGVTGRRFRAIAWDAGLPDGQAAQAAGAPVGWLGLGQQTIFPPGEIAKRRVAAFNEDLRTGLGESRR